MTELVHIAVSLLPVFIFLTSLIFLDSYKLVKINAVLRTIAVGCLVALICLLINNWVSSFSFLEFSTLTRYVAPASEELLKSLFLVYLVKSKKIGFMVDAAIYGFAIGAGFAFVENIFYLQSLQNSSIFLWIIRGFGTAVMHSTATAIFGILSRSMADRASSEKISNFLPGLLAAIAIHSLYNHFLLPPILITVAFMIILPLLIFVVFEQSERATRKWLGVGFDTDMELLEIINTGKISETRIGTYLHSLKASFPGPIVADMLCLLRIYLELGIRAKGILLARESGLNVTIDREIASKFEELEYLEKSIGKTGKLAILPFLHFSSRDLWQLYMLSK